MTPGGWLDSGMLVRVRRNYDDDGTCVGIAIRETRSIHTTPTKTVYPVWKVLYDGRLFDISARMLEPLEK